MELISVEHRNELIDSAHHTLKIELWDWYAIDSVVFDAWRNGDTATFEAVTSTWVEDVRVLVAKGGSGRRVKIISEPLSEYQRFAVEASGVLVEAGEKIRWLPRRLTSGLMLPGNDAMVLGSEAVVFNVIGHDGQRLEVHHSADPAIVKQCTNAFEAAWALATPHNEYHPQIS